MPQEPAGQETETADERARRLAAEDKARKQAAARREREVDAELRALKKRLAKEGHGARRS
jgi:hypothetical protein